MTASEFIADQIADIRGELLEHSIYRRVDSPSALRIFMRSHIFAVWDFMSLLGRLRREVTCPAAPWLPPTDAALARFVNEITLGEECDEDGRGGYASHFDLYREAMAEQGADTDPIDEMLDHLRSGRSWEDALGGLDVPRGTSEFTRHNLDLATNGSAAEVAAAFCFGREDLIPEMFTRLVATLQDQGSRTERFVYYLQRHIEIDGDEHGPLSRRLVDRLCGDDRSTWNAAAGAAREAIAKRIGLWDGIADEIRLRSDCVEHVSV
ncbi:DUF3050 domain-containing protein [Stratiformator vulcanicus]|nr:DUF3050 domain-containing protein [Stratiformator vulcanicus]